MYLRCHHSFLNGEKEYKRLVEFGKLADEVYLGK
jgi:hypothetical protein